MSFHGHRVGLKIRHTLINPFICVNNLFAQTHAGIKIRIIGTGMRLCALTIETIIYKTLSRG
jgi:hypothetical protein